MKRNISKITSRLAMTLTELIVVVAIIGLITTMAVPTVTTQFQKAKKSTAEAECQQIAKAMELCATRHGYYVPIHVLDDIFSDVNNLLTGSRTIVADDLDNELGYSSGRIYLIDPFVDLDTQNNSGNQAEMDDGQGSGYTNRRVYDMINEWGGPFMTFSRSFEDTQSSDRRTILRRDFPLDPWGQPYRFYCNLGLIGENQADSSDANDWESDSVFNGRLPTTQPTSPRFDRFAIVSYGPDMEEDDLNDYTDGTGDDIYCLFGGSFNTNRF